VRYVNAVKRLKATSVSKSSKWGGFCIGDMVIFEKTGEWCILVDLNIYNTPQLGHVNQVASNWSYEDVHAVWTVRWGNIDTQQTKLLDLGLVSRDNLVNGKTLENIYKTRGSRDGNVVTISGVVYGSVYTRQI
jgi:hypothetical protein